MRKTAFGLLMATLLVNSSALIEPAVAQDYHFRHIDDLARRMRNSSTEICRTLLRRFGHNFRKDESYRNAYRLYQRSDAVRRIAKHAYDDTDLEEMREQMERLDGLFHSFVHEVDYVEKYYQTSWRRHHRELTDDVVRFSNVMHDLYEDLDYTPHGVGHWKTHCKQCMGEPYAPPSTGSHHSGHHGGTLGDLLDDGPPLPAEPKP